MKAPSPKLLFFFVLAMSLMPVVAEAATLETMWTAPGGCPAGWTNSGLNDDGNSNGLHHIGEEDTDAGDAVLCLRSDSATITAAWGLGACPSGTAFAQIYDDAGDSTSTDAPFIHNMNEEDFRPDGSNAYWWCLGASANGGGTATLSTHWVMWASDTKGPPCPAGETALALARNGSHNLNHEDLDGVNQETLCGVITVESPPTVSLTATPSTVASGESSTLTWSSSGASYCTGSNFTVPGSATSGSISTGPQTASTNYYITCYKPSGLSASALALVTVTAAPPPPPAGAVSGTCSASPSSVYILQGTTWTAYPSGGDGTYTYRWGGGVTGLQKSVVKSYGAPGSYGANVTITSSGVSSGVITCSNTVTVSYYPGVELNAWGIAPTKATSTVPVTLSTTVYNDGNTATNRSYSTLFQVSNTSTGASPTDIGTYVRTAAHGSGSSYKATLSYAFPDARTYYVRACADKSSAADTGVITEYNENNNCTAWASVVVDGPKPDLTAGATSVSATPTEDVPTTFSAQASNISTSVAAGSFPLLFEIQRQGRRNDWESYRLVNSAYIAGLAPRATSTAITASHTFIDAGTFQVRACANYDTAWTAILGETNYDNNCGPWSASFSVAAAGFACTVDNTDVPVGGRATYTASNSGEDSFTWTGSDGWSRTDDRSVYRNYATAGSYGMQVQEARGARRTAVCPIVDVGVVCTNPTASISATPDRVRAGESTTISWSASGVASCTISGPGLNQTVAAASCVLPSGSANVAISGQSVYTITCDGTSATKQVVVNLLPRVEEF